MKVLVRRAVHHLLWWTTGWARRWRRIRLRLTVVLLRVRDGTSIRCEIASDVLLDGPIRVKCRHRDATGSLTIRSGVEIGTGVEIWLGNGHLVIGENTVVRSECVMMADGDITVGPRTVLSWRCYLLSTERIEIGADVAFAQGCSVVDSRHVWGPRASSYMDHTETAPVCVEDAVFLGTNAVLIAGAHVGHHSVVGAAAVVSGSHPPAGLLLGAPAQWRPLPERLGGAALQR
jgi:acetyltransferase-like isoleucine patch superfamily enzyme